MDFVEDPDSQNRRALWWINLDTGKKTFIPFTSRTKASGENYSDFVMLPNKKNRILLILEAVIPVFAGMTANHQ